MVGFALTHEEVMNRWDASRSEKRSLTQLYRSWSGWPTIEETAAIWQAASDETGNRNSEEGLLRDEELMEVDVSEETVKIVRDFADHHREIHRSQGQGEVELHRFVGEPVEVAKGFAPKVVESWAHTPAHIPRFARNIGGREEGSVVTATLGMDSTYASYRTVAELPTEQSEFVVALPFHRRYGHFEVRSLGKFMGEEGL